MKAERLCEANDDADRPSELSAFLASEGYLFFRGVLDPDAVTTVADAFAESLWRQGGDGGAPCWEALDASQVDPMTLRADVPQDVLTGSPATQQLCRLVLGADPYVFPSAPLRWMLPALGEYLLPPHQDIAYLGPEDDWRIFWVPLVDMRGGLGGLEIAPRCHRSRTIFAHEKHSTQTSQTTRLALYGIPDGDRFGPWASADYRVGDVLVLDPYMVHRSLPNRSADRIRLSMDFRAQPVDAPRNAHATRAVPKVDRQPGEILGSR